MTDKLILGHTALTSDDRSNVQKMHNDRVAGGGNKKVLEAFEDALKQDLGAGDQLQNWCWNNKNLIRKALSEGPEKERWDLKAGIFKNAEGLKNLAEADEFWESMPYETRLYFGDGIADYLHRGVLRGAIKVLEGNYKDNQDG